MHARLVTIAAALALFLPAPTLAQTSDAWKGTFSPMYFWASELSGDATVRNETTPVFLSFADAADKLGAAFSFHVEAQKGRVGFFGDLSFVRLSSTSQFTIQLPSPRPVEGEIDLDNTFFEAGLAVDFGSDTDDENLQKYDVTYYGPIFGVNFHWGAR